MRPSRVQVSSTLVATLAALVASGLASAQPAPTPLPPVVVTAARAPQPVSDLIADVTVFGPEEIARAGADTLIDLLKRQPGVEVVRNGGPGAVSGVFLRGANAAQTLVLIDGVRVGSSTTGAATIEAIPLDDIERVEILRGPASSLYGADAIGGVIQIFTRRGGGAFTANARAGGGTYGTWTANAGASGSASNITYALQGGGRGSNGFNAIVDPNNSAFNADRDGYGSASASANATAQWASGQAIDANYLYNRLNAQFDAGPGFDDRTITTLQTGQVASRNAITAHWTSRLSAGVAIDDSRSMASFGDSTFKTTQAQYGWQNELALGPVTPAPGTLGLGWERRDERVSTNAGFAVTSRSTDALFAIYRLAREPHYLQANARYDDSSQYGSRTTGTIAYGYRISPEWRLNASYGTGFKAPTFNDLYYPGSSNPNLVPETSHNAEAGVVWMPAFGGGSIQASVRAYRNRVSDLIVYECDVNFNCAPQNVASATLEGVTSVVDVRLDGGTIAHASLDLASPTDDTGKLLPRRARTYGALTLTQPIGAASVGVEVVASSYRYDDAANAVRLAGYAIVNLVAEWRFAPRWTAFLRADNVFDRSYELAAGYSTGGATVFGGVRWQL